MGLWKITAYIARPGQQPNTSLILQMVQDSYFSLVSASPGARRIPSTEQKKQRKHLWCLRISLEKKVAEDQE
jgi:hypothetical protein